MTAIGGMIVNKRTGPIQATARAQPALTTIRAKQTAMMRRDGACAVLRRALTTEPRIRLKEVTPNSDSSSSGPACSRVRLVTAYATSRLVWPLISRSRSMRPTWATPGQSRWGNTVVIVRALLDRPENDVSVALGCFGGGSMLDALLLPRILDRLPDRAVMLPAAGLLGAVLRAFAGLLGGAAWF